MVPRSGSHRIDNTQKHRQRCGAGGGAEGGPRLVLHRQVEHAGAEVVARELDGHLDLPALLLLLARLRVQLVPPVRKKRVSGVQSQGPPRAPPCPEGHDSHRCRLPQAWEEPLQLQAPGTGATTRIQCSAKEISKWGWFLEVVVAQRLKCLPAMGQLVDLVHGQGSPELRVSLACQPGTQARLPRAPGQLVDLVHGQGSPELRVSLQCDWP